MRRKNRGLADRLTGRSANRPWPIEADRPSGQAAGWPAGRPIGRPAGRLAGWPTGRLAGRPFFEIPWFGRHRPAQRLNPSLRTIR